MKPKTAKPGEALPPLPESVYPPDAVPLPSAPSFVGDEHWGKSGNYIVVDGKRVPAPPETPESPDTEKGN